MFEHARDILLVIDAQSGSIIDANAAAVHAYGYPVDALKQLTIFDLRALDLPPITEQMRQASQAGILFETMHRRSDGSAFDVEVSSRGETLDGRRVLFSVIRDITERKRLQREREALIEATKAALDMRDEFLVIASHELRSPVTCISLLLEQVLRLAERSDGPAALTSAAQNALDEVHRLAALVTAILEARATAGNVDLARASIDLADVIRIVETRLRPRAELAGSVLTVDVPSVEGLWDQLRLDQVFSNLVINAIKYGQGRPIRVIGTRHEQHVEIEVRDEGIGIHDADLGRIFEKFGRAVPTDRGGLGLGLYITRQLVEAHGGSVTVRSAPDAGSSFRVSLPLSPV